MVMVFNATFNNISYNMYGVCSQKKSPNLALNVTLNITSDSLICNPKYSLRQS